MSDVLGIGKAIEKLADPVVDLLKRVAGPAADEIGLTFQDAVHVYRAKRAYRLGEKFRQFVQERGIQPKSVNLKLLLPILDNASVEEDEDLHTMWAALLTNAADPAGSHVLPSFVEVLKQLTKSEAVFLNKFYEAAVALGPSLTVYTFRLDQAYNLWGQGADSDDSFDSLIFSLDDLRRLGLIQSKPIFNETGYYLTDYAVKFVQACRCSKT